MTKGATSLRLVRPKPTPGVAPGGRQAKPLPWSRWSAHPADGLTPERIVSCYRNAEAGYLADQADLFDDILETDGHLAGLVESRIQAVAGKEWLIQPGAQDDLSIRAAGELQAALERNDDNFVEFLEHQLTATGYGYAASEIDWELVDGRVVPAWFANVAHRRFRLTPDNELKLTTETDLAEGVALTPGRWCINRRRHHNLARAGLLRTATWWSCFKRFSVRDWVVFAEKFGVPHVTGIYEESASEKARAALEEAVADIGEGGQAILSEATRIVITETGQRAGDPGSVHPALIALCEAQMSKLISGATLNVETQGPGSFALGKVHQGRAFSLELGDSLKLSRVFRQQVGHPFIRYNGFEARGAKSPRLKIQVVQELDPETRVRVASVLANELGAEIDGAQLFDELGLRKPTRDEDRLVGTKAGGKP